MSFQIVPERCNAPSALKVRTILDAGAAFSETREPTRRFLRRKKEDSYGPESEWPRTGSEGFEDFAEFRQIRSSEALNGADRAGARRVDFRASCASAPKVPRPVHLLPFCLLPSGSLSG